MVPSEYDTATVSEMIQRFRNSKPTSRATRNAMRLNGDAPLRMWYTVNSSNSDCKDSKIHCKCRRINKVSSSRDEKNENLFSEDNDEKTPEPWRYRFRFQATDENVSDVE